MNERTRKISWIASVCCAALVAAASIGLIVYGVYNEPPAQLLRVDWTMGLANYEAPASQSEDLIWPREQIPIVISVQSEDKVPFSVSDDEFGEVQQAVIRFNRDHARLTLLNIGTDPEKCSAVVLWGVAREGIDTPAGLVTHERLSNGHLKATIRLAETSSLELTARVLEHEFGHLVGLAHVDSPGDLMFPIAREEVSLRDRPRMSDAARARLHELYGEER